MAETDKEIIERLQETITALGKRSEEEQPLFESMLRKIAELETENTDLINATALLDYDKLQAEKVSADKVLSNPKVSVFWSHEPRAFIRQGEKLAVEMENLKTHEKITETRDGIFIFVGMVPNSKFLQNRQMELELNKWGYIPTNEVMQTNVEGVYAAGDIRDKSYRQITTAVADGTIAALQIIRNS